MKSAFLSLLLLFTVTQVTHGATNPSSLSEDFSLQPNQEKLLTPLNQHKNNQDDEDDAPLVPTY
jgi:hypothetical protein